MDCLDKLKIPGFNRKFYEEFLHKDICDDAHHELDHTHEEVDEIKEQEKARTAQSGAMALSVAPAAVLLSLAVSGAF